MVVNRYEPVLLLVGDVVVFYVALWLTLTLRYLELPSEELWQLHVLPFSYLLPVLLLVYFISGLYDPHTTLHRRKLPSLITQAQLTTVILAAVFFFTVPYFGITPKTVLLIFLVTSSLLAVVWRLYLSRFVGMRRVARAFVLGSGPELDELVAELNQNPRYGILVAHHFAPEEVVVSDQLQTQLLQFVADENMSVIIADVRDEDLQKLTPVFYNILLLHPGLLFLDALRMYESIFRRIPISMLEHSWFLEHITRERRLVYDLLHRALDIALSLGLGLVTLVLFPFVAGAIKYEDRGPLFSYQRRVGKDNQPVDLVKFRTMTVANDAGKWEPGKNKVTRVGAFLRQTRIDELPQLWNVLMGGYSLIGPRPEFAPAVATYAEQIPYYNARHLITPGLSGWAQLNHQAHPHHGVDIEETRNKLSYDLYYLKHRSIALDIEIGLKTIKTLLAAVGK